MQRSFVAPLLVFSHVRPGADFAMSNYPQASPLATAIWEQHHDDLKSISETPSLDACDEWNGVEGIIVCLKREWHSENVMEEDVSFSLTWYRSHLQSP